MKEFCGLRAKTYAYLLNDDSANEKVKEANKSVIKRELLFRNYADCLFKDKTLIKSQQRFKSGYHNVYTEQINKTDESSNDDKELQTFNKVTTYPHGTNSFKLCEIEMLMVKKYKDFVFNDKNHIKKTKRSVFSKMN